MKDVAAACSGRGITILAIKGSAFFGLEYADLSERWMTDLDVLVRESDFGATERVLVELGATPAQSENVLIRRSYERLYYIRTGQVRLAVDLHHALAHPEAFPIDYGRVFADAEPHPLEDLRRAGVRRPAAHHSLIILALHQLYDAYPAEFRNFLDAERILKRNRVDSRRLAAEARSWGALSALRFFLTRGDALEIVHDVEPLLAELRVSRLRRTAIGMLLDPARSDPFRIPLKSKRARQILLFYLFGHLWGAAVRFPLHILRLKTGGLVERAMGKGDQQIPPADVPPPV